MVLGAFAHGNDDHMLEQLIANGFIDGSGYAIIALSLGCLYRLTRELHLELGGFFLLGGYMTVVAGDYSVTTGITLMLGGAVGAVVLALLLDRFIFAPLRGVATSETFLLVCLGLLICSQNALALVFGPSPLSVKWTVVVTSLELGGVSVTGPQIAILLVALVLGLGTWLVLERTRVGAQWRAVACDRELARIAGVNDTNVNRATFIGASIVAYLAGALVTLDTAIQPISGFSIVLFGFIGAVIGGFGSVAGPPVGAAIIGVVQSLAVIPLPSAWKDAVAFGVFIAFLALRPAGIFPGLQKAEQL